MLFKRHIYPVGHGGFASETIGGFTIVFDCGSDVCPVRVSQYINRLHAEVNRIDLLFVSHFDKDHVSSISELIGLIPVGHIVIPSIPDKFKYVYNQLTNGAYYNILGLAAEGQKLIEVQEHQSFGNGTDIWEWVAKSMIKVNDWNKIENKLTSNGINIKQLDNPQYVDANLPIIKDVFESVFPKGSGGLNAHGIVLLSQKVNGVVASNAIDCNRGHEVLQNLTGCFYTGDANLIRKRNNAGKSFLDKYKREGRLLFCQLPHHGSQYNARPDFDTSFASQYYFYQDNTDARIRKNAGLYASLTAHGELVEVRDVDSDEVTNIINIR